MKNITTAKKKDYSKEIKSHSSSTTTFSVNGKNYSYGLGGQGITKAFKENVICNQRLAVIPKKYLGIDKSYQRMASRRQIENIFRKFDIANFDIPAVYKIKHGKKFYYQIVDGQHRCCANQDEEILCRIVNTKAAVTRCLEANAASRKRSWSLNDMFWGKIVELERCHEVKDDLHRKTRSQMRTVASDAAEQTQRQSAQRGPVAQRGSLGVTKARLISRNDLEKRRLYRV